MSEVVDKIAKYKVPVFFTTAGIANLFTEEFAFGGASSFLQGIYTPYSTELMDDFIGGKPQKYVSEQVAKDMAQSCFAKFPIPNECVVVSCTAVLAKRTNERKERVNEAWICVLSDKDMKTYHFNYNDLKSEYPSSRYRQECAVADDILKCLFNFLGE